MVPWSIALIALAYAAVASASAAALAKIAQGTGTQPAFWPALWLAVSLALLIGLAQMKPWARRLAVWSSVLIASGAAGIASASLARPVPEPGWALAATGVASLQLLIIRYLTRPRVKAWFGSSSAKESTWPASITTKTPT